MFDLAFEFFKVEGDAREFQTEKGNYLLIDLLVYLFTCNKQIISISYQNLISPQYQLTANQSWLTKESRELSENY